MRLILGLQHDEMTAQHRSIREPFMHFRQYNCLSCSAEASRFVLSSLRDSPAQDTLRSRGTKHPRGQAKRPISYTCHWLARSGKVRAHHGLHKKRAYPSYEPTRISSQHATRQTSTSMHSITIPDSGMPLGRPSSPDPNTWDGGMVSYSQ